MSERQALGTQLASVLDWHDAHVDFDAAVAGIPADAQGRVPPGLPHSPWQLLEHIRITQHDILDFCVNPSYEEMTWPDDYWPTQPAPPSTTAWAESVAAYTRDRQALQALARGPDDLFAKIPHGGGQTYLRELLLVADHTSHHIGQLVTVRQALGVWPSS